MKRLLIIFVAIVMAASFSMPAQAQEVFTKDVTFEQQVKFMAGVSGISDISFIRKFYVLKSSAALYPLASRELKTNYPDGQRKLYTTIAAAISACVDDRGDVIYILPGHTETIAAATEFALDKSGVRIIGLGVGSSKPLLTFSATGSIITISDNDTFIENIRLLSNIDNCVTGVSITADADGTVLKDVEFVDGATNKEFLICVAIATTCNDIILDGVKHFGLAGGASSCVVTAGTAPNLIIKNCMMQGTYSASVLDLSGGAIVDAFISKNVLVQRTASGVYCYKGNAASTGILAENMMGASNNGTNPISETTAIHCVGNLGIDLPNAGHIVIPAAGAI